MKLLSSFIVGAILSFQVFAGCEQLLPFGYPTVKADQAPTLLCRRMYAVSHSPTRHTAHWAAEHLVKKDLLVDAVRENAFKADPDLPPNEVARPSDYAGSGYDQGHMAPVGDMHADTIAMLESFYLSNMVPQVPGNNRDGWNHLEYLVRGYALKRGELFVITGPVYNCNDCKTIGKTKVAIPTHLYKIVYDPKTKSVISFLIPNIAFNGKDIPLYVSNIAAIESATGVTFFPKSKVKMKEATAMWEAN